ncbi:orotidine-5'-phosphate decarboxylase [Candidatus Rhabdochlamydia porcellionis]|jgi:uridine monophosphate synthetase|uniref:Orotidine 5'-phosphate decarboxylase n=1 Tax=Candidatus Rhabdochlamydia porcellionis TaxID=225148 RepID=A0ABX8Z0U6_9BACT|nr:orotidine-5'-phosphate decarboxylase [Candidatus Rhabdochlamydia porcellionis]QZA59301.1 Orotidine 5'-phosphate decarboxylase [Candidatus Rhabdochlamydia porcellionis]
MIREYSYEQRIAFCPNPVAKKLLNTCKEKQSNLCVAADFTSSEALITFAESVGSEICMLKTHIDILNDFHPNTTKKLQELSHKENFMIFEDRKFADIGNTVQLQYQGGPFKMIEWADLINAHSVVGPDIISALKNIGLSSNRALLLLAEMSSFGTLAKEEYTEATIKMAEQHEDFVIGFICLKKISNNPKWIYFTPGIQFANDKDLLGQTYQTPDSAIKSGSDIIIVGRGIYQAENPKQAANKYRKAGWSSYVFSLSS